MGCQQTYIRVGNTRLKPMKRPLHDCVLKQDESQGDHSHRYII